MRIAICMQQRFQNYRFWSTVCSCVETQVWLLCFVFLFFQNKNSTFSIKTWDRIVPNLHHQSIFNPNSFFPLNICTWGFLPPVMLGNVVPMCLSLHSCLHRWWVMVESFGISRSFPHWSQLLPTLGNQLSARSSQPPAPALFPTFRWHWVQSTT